MKHSQPGDRLTGMRNLSYIVSSCLKNGSLLNLFARIVCIFHF